MARKIRVWDAVDTLETKEDIAAYLDAVLEDGDPDLLKAALGKGMTEIAQAAGLGPRQSLQDVLAGRQSGVCDRRQGAKGSWARLSVAA
jgi:probable addiction module antidote protein